MLTQTFFAPKMAKWWQKLLWPDSSKSGDSRQKCR